MRPIYLIVNGYAHLSGLSGLHRSLISTARIRSTRRVSAAGGHGLLHLSAVADVRGNLQSHLALMSGACDHGKGKAMTESQPIHAPPPWQLRGQGYIILIRCSREFSETLCGWTCRVWPGAALGGIGTVMVVDYSESAVGPYRELLLVPGRFDVEGRKRFAVTDILVSSQVQRGQRPAQLGAAQDAGGVPAAYGGKWQRTCSRVAGGPPLRGSAFRASVPVMAGHHRTRAGRLAHAGAALGGSPLHHPHQRPWPGAAGSAHRVPDR